jgi:ligand-binding sensor domain-containing protein/signal transduction histidine kinase
MLVLLGVWAVSAGAGVLLSAPRVAHAQQPSLRFARLSAAQGLSHNRVNSIVQDDQGFLWLGTGEGLNRYDGYTFTVYKSDPDDPQSLADNTVFTVHEDRDGTLWVGTLNGGLHRFDRATGRFVRFQHDPANPHSLAHNRVVAILDSQGALLVATAAGVDRLDRATNSFTHAAFRPALPAQPPASVGGAILYEDRGGVVWAGTAWGLYRLDAVEFVFERVLVPHAAPDLAVSALLEDSAGQFWIGSSDGLYRFDRAQNKAQRFAHNPADARSLSANEVLALAEDRDGALWVGTAHDGLNRFERADETFSSYRNDPGNPFSLLSDTAQLLYVDRGGLLWVGAGVSGLSILDPATRHFGLYRHEPAAKETISAQVIAAVVEDSAGIVWAGGYDEDGLSALDRRNGSVRVYRHDPDDPQSISHDSIYEIYEDRAGTLWVGTLGGGLNRFERRTKTFTRFQHDPDDPHSLSNDVVPTILEDRHGDLWVGTEDGLNRFDPQSETFTRYYHNPDDPHSLGHSEISHLYEDAGGTLWVSTWGGGLNRFDRSTERFTRYLHDPDDPASIGDDRIYMFTGDHAGNLWLGTRAGLNRFSPQTGRFTRYTEKNGLPGTTARCVQIDTQGQVWVGTSHALARFDPQSESFTRFDERDGLQSYGFNGGACSQSRRGELFFGGLDGFNAFFPQAIRPNEQPPRLALTTVYVLNEPLALGHSLTTLDDLTLSHADKVVTFEFAALDFADPEHNQYAYMLEGFDEGWTQAGNRRSATYTNLDDGDYVFRVRAANSDGVWNEQGVALALHVTTPPWRSWWAYSIYTSALIGLLAGATRYVSQVQANRSLRAEIAERKRAEREQQRLYRVAEGLREVVAAINGNRPLLEILDFIVGQARGLLQVEAGQIYRLQPKNAEQGHELRVEASQGFAAAYIGAVLRATPRTISYQAIQRGEPIAIADAAAVLEQLLAQPSLSPEQRNLVTETYVRFRAVLAVPLIVGGEVYGTITLYNAERRTWSEEDTKLATVFAAQSALAIENAYLRERVEQAAIREERVRLAHDLHDSVTQSLYSLALLAEGWRMGAREEQQTQTEQRFARLGGIAHDALREMRLLIYELRLPELDDEGLVGAIERRLDAVERRAGLDAQLRVEGAVALPLKVAEQLYRIVQEALNNMLKHATASAVAVIIRARPADDGALLALELEVRDNGCGFDVAATQRGFGLDTMHERAAKLGAHLDINSAPGEGTSILLRGRFFVTER